MTAKVSLVLLVNRIRPEPEKKSYENQNGSQRYQLTTSRFLNIHRIIEGI